MNIDIEKYLTQEEIKTIVSKALYVKLISTPISPKDMKKYLGNQYKVKEINALKKEQIESDIQADLQKYYIYIFRNNDWNGAVFYCGKGTGGRYKQFSGRSKHITSVINQYNCSSEIILANLTSDEAYQKEKEYKEYYKDIGMPIIDSEIISNHEAQRKGIQRAKAEGKYKGRKPIKIDGFENHLRRLENKEITKSALARELGISNSTLFRMIKDYSIRGE